MADIAMFTNEQLRTLRNNGVVNISGKLYRMCCNCRKIVQVNKTFLGSVHICE